MASVLMTFSRRALHIGLIAALTAVGTQGVANAPDADLAVVIYVDQHPEGSGSASQQLTIAPTIAEALATARRLRASGEAPRGIAIELAPGIHRIGEPIRLTAADSGSEGSPLIIRGSRNGRTSLRGSVEILPTGLAAKNPRFGRLPELARAHALLYTLPRQVSPAQRIDSVRSHDASAGMVAFEVFDEDGPLHPARWPNDGWSMAHHGDGANLYFAPDANKHDWRQEPDLWVGGFFNWNWAFETLPALGERSGSPTLRLAKTPEFGFSAKPRAFVYNALTELDAPGEWYGDTKLGQLVAWPRDASKSALEISVAQSLFQLEDTSHVRFESLTFEMTRGDAVRIKGGTDIEVAQCTIRWTGGRAVSIVGARTSGVAKSRIEGTGEGGIWLSGGDRPQLVPGELFVSDTIISNFARLGRTYRPAIKIDGVGNRAVGNYIAEAPHAAILFTGNDHLIERNEITRVTTDTSDAGAIYTGRDWTARGTIIRNNFLHDLRAAAGFETKGVYLDDFASGTTVEGNIFLRVDQPVFIGGGRDNTVVGNIFVDSSPGVFIDARGLTWAKNAVHDGESELRGALAAMPVASATWKARYPGLSSVMSDDPAEPKRNRAAGNLFIESEPYETKPEVNLELQKLDPAQASPMPGALASTKLERARDFRPLFAYQDLPDLKSLPYDAMDRLEALQR
jgi:hypothetical protein